MNDHYQKTIFLMLDNFRRSKIRFALTVFGVTVGIAMVIIVSSAGEGVKGLILNEISSFGNDWIHIEVKIPSAQKHSTENISGLSRGITITTLSTDDLAAITKLNNVSNAYAGITTQTVVAYNNEKDRPSVFGVSASYIDITRGDLADGRFFTNEEDRSAASVIVLGSEVEKILFADQNAVGKTVKVDGNAYHVVGIMKPLGATGFFNMDEIVYIPIQTTQKKIMGVNHVLWILAQTVNSARAEFTAEEIRWLLRDRHDISDPEKDDFLVTTQVEAISIVGTIVRGITWLLIGLATISLLVGGVGIMNVMYVSVAERTYEIGLCKAVGATERNILRQFLLEAMVMTMLGGLIGIVIGAFISSLIALIAVSLGYAWTFGLPTFSIILGFVFSLVVGIFFGFYPAKKAASLDPIVAMRQE